MAYTKIADGLYYVGIQNPNLRVFDIVMQTEFGTTYNSYILKSGGKTALIETCHSTFLKQFLTNIEEVCPIAQLDYIILNHNEPDHSGALAEIIKLNPSITIIASQAGGIYLKNITNLENLNVKTVKDGETLDLGGYTLKFINAPFLHWPDSMFTWCEELKALFSCDFFGAHYCEPYVFDYNVAYPQKYKSAFKYYYDAIFGPFSKYVAAGLDKIKDLPIELACTSHGPILTQSGLLGYVRESYADWSAPKALAAKSVAVFYCSAYGYTKAIAKTVAAAIEAEMPGAAVRCCDLIEHDMAEMQALLNSCDAFAIGSPTINKDAVPPVWELLGHVDAVNCAKKPCLIFGSYGWSGEAVGNIEGRLTALKMNVFDEKIKVQFKPGSAELEAAAEAARKFAKSII